MNRPLRKEDALIVDLLLDSRVEAGRKPQFSVSNVDRQRLTKVERLLETLHLLEEPEVPGDLVTRTLKFIDQAVVGTDIGASLPQPIASSRPHA